MKNKPYFLVAIILVYSFSPIAAMGQSLPHTFSANTAAKASEVNENFTYLLERFGTRKTTVNCYSGESITTALKNYNHIVISGVCTENISLDGESLPHRVVILEGSSSTSDGISASDTSKPVINVFNGSITLKISKLKITGGTRGIEGYLGPTIILNNILVENNTSFGIANWSGSRLFIKESTIQNNGETAIISGESSYVEIVRNTITGHTNYQSILITRAGSAWIANNTITNGKDAGIRIESGASAYIRHNTIQSAENGISVSGSSYARLRYNTINNNSKSGLYVENNGSVVLEAGNTFSNNSEYGIRVFLAGSLNMWGDAQLTSPTTISGNTKGPIRVDEGGSAYLRNLTLASQSKEIEIYSGNFVKFDNVTLQGGEFGIVVWRTNIGLENSTISGHTDAEIYAETSTIDLRNTAISGTAGSNEIKLTYGSKLFIGTGTTITGTVYCDGSVDNKSIGNWINLSLTTSGC